MSACRGETRARSGGLAWRAALPRRDGRVQLEDGVTAWRVRPRLIGDASAAAAPAPAAAVAADDAADDDGGGSARADQMRTIHEMQAVLDSNAADMPDGAYLQLSNMLGLLFQASKGDGGDATSSDA